MATMPSSVLEHVVNNNNGLPRPEQETEAGQDEAHAMTIEEFMKTVCIPNGQRRYEGGDTGKLNVATEFKRGTLAHRRCCYFTIIVMLSPTIYL
jgi:hypothetical protein